MYWTNYNRIEHGRPIFGDEHGRDYDANLESFLTNIRAQCYRHRQRLRWEAFREWKGERLTERDEWYVSETMKTQIERTRKKLIRMLPDCIRSLEKRCRD